MQVYIVEYDSPDNAFKGYAVIRASNLKEVQDKFLDWLKKQGVYQHLWKLSFKIIGDNHKPFVIIE